MLLPLEVLAEEKIELESIKNGLLTVPPWITPKDAQEELEKRIKLLEEHIAKYGNDWATDQP